MAITNPELQTKQEAARGLRVCVRTIENLIKARALAVIRIGRCVRITQAEINRFKAAHTVQATD
ncbi:MAG: helix-turn-helix domain-containing protein [Roseimicrobium sp.]